MAVRKIDTGWELDIRPEGRNGPRVRKVFLTKAEALRFENFVKTEVAQGRPWNPAPKDNRRLSELIELWFQQHGQHLKYGEGIQRKLVAMANALGNPVARSLTPERYLTYRQSRAEEGIHAKTLNNELGYLNAVYNELKRTQQITYDNALKAVRPIKLRERELSFLSLDQIRELLNVMERHSRNPHVLLVTKLSLATGCRWREAEKLHIRQIGQGRVTFLDTKSGRNRTVLITEDLERELRAHEQQYGIDGKLFTGSLGAFRMALAKSQIRLPTGQASHVLRHSFASHFIMNGGDILTLQKILGHSAIMMTMRYSHLSEKHFDVSRTLNPIAYL